MIGCSTEMRALGGPPKKSSKKTICFELGWESLIDQATTAPLNGAVNGLWVLPIVFWNPVVFPIAWHESGQDGVAGVAAPSTTVFGAAEAAPAPTPSMPRASVSATSATPVRRGRAYA